MTDTPFKVGETYRTRGGGTARVICVDAKGDWPVITLHIDAFGREFVCHHKLNGLCNDDDFPHDCDLLPPDPPKSVRVRRWFLPNSSIGWSRRERTNNMIAVILTIPPDIAAQCDWLKEPGVEIVNE